MNIAYRKLCPYYQLPDATERDVAVAQDTATTKAMQAVFATTTPAVGSIPKRTLWHLWQELHRVKAAGRADADVLNVMRISPTYYALVAKYQASDEKPAFILIFQDVQADDATLKFWYWRQTVIPE